MEAASRDVRSEARSMRACRRVRILEDGTLAPVASLRDSQMDIEDVKYSPDGAALAVLPPTPNPFIREHL